MTFQISKFMEAGTSNPLVVRLGIGLYDVIKLTKLDERVKLDIQEGCFKIMKSLVEAEKHVEPLMNEIKQIELQIETEGVKTQSNGMVIETPGVMLLDNTKPFLAFAKEALTTLADTMGIIMGKSYKGPHFHVIAKDAKEFFGTDHVVTKLIDADQTWIKEIIDFRNEIEHPQSGKPFTTGFYISKRVDGKFLVNVPRFFDGSMVLNRLEVFSHNLLTFTEELIAYSMTKFLFSPMMVLQEIPENQRNKSLPVRFHIGLSAQAIREFESNIASNS